MSEHFPNEQFEIYGEVEPSSPFVDVDRTTFEGIFENDLVISKQPYEMNEFSPTPLDPFHLMHNGGVGYFVGASVLMEQRLHEAAENADLPQPLEEIIVNEIIYEHHHRSQKNNLAMRQLREAFRGVPVGDIDPQTVELILRARSATADIYESASLLASVPEMEAIEVMKYTAPLDERGLTFAHAKFIYNTRRTNDTMEDFQIDNMMQSNTQARAISNTNTDSRIIVTKRKEADLTVKGQKLELIGRYNYIVIDPTINLTGVRPNLVKLGGNTVNRQPIDM
ncbi:MAG TPA: hypothetical protein VFM68_01045, partial [Candidatus Saccharimonadales bacterium]|nr:hypothetical protein [Candidatus Saccharimonadales bacterium]